MLLTGTLDTPDLGPSSGSTAEAINSKIQRVRALIEGYDFEL
jgi:hypothetical protein